MTLTITIDINLLAYLMPMLDYSCCRIDDRTVHVKEERVNLDNLCWGSKTILAEKWHRIVAAYERRVDQYSSDSARAWTVIIIIVDVTSSFGGRSVQVDSPTPSSGASTLGNGSTCLEQRFL